MNYSLTSEKKKKKEKVINGEQNCHPVEVANFTFSQSPSDFQEIRDLFSCHRNV